MTRQPARTTQVLGRMADVEGRAAGGYANAERCRLLLGRAEVLDGEDMGSHLAVAEVQGNFMFDPATHRDFLGVRGHFVKLSTCCAVRAALIRLGVVLRCALFTALTLRLPPCQAVLGTGIERNRVGDIVIQGERGAQARNSPNSPGPFLLLLRLNDLPWSPLSDTQT